MRLFCLLCHYVYLRGCLLPWRQCYFYSASTCWWQCATSIVSNISAIAYFYKVDGFADPSKCFIVAKVVAGAPNIASVPDVCLPVTLPVFTILVLALPTVFTSRYKCLMFRAMMVLAFKVYLRVDEMVHRSRSQVRGYLHICVVLLSAVPRPSW